MILNFYPSTKVLQKLLWGFLLAAFLPLSVQAQSDWGEGYLVTTAGDTIRGTLRDRDTGTFENLYGQVRIKPDRGRRRRFKPGQLQSYRIGDRDYQVFQLRPMNNWDSELVVNDEVGNPWVFRVVHVGKLSLYYHEFTDEDNSYIDYIPYFKKQGDTMLVRATQGAFGLKKKLLSNYFRDRPDIVKAIQSGALKTPMEVVMAY